ncbi:hypothetical protein [Crossiella sp. SN42]|nr:hypothetical protein [Crossiella sp. SN42]
MHPTGLLPPIRTHRDRAKAVRQLDRRFGSPEVVARFEARPVLVP